MLMNLLNRVWVGGVVLMCGGLSAIAVPRQIMKWDTDSLSGRPDHVNNADSRYFPPVFNQDGGSCGSASRIGYMFTHEINAFRGTDASQPEHIYPTHFTWLLTNSHSGKEGMAMANGVPDATVYGGTTYSKVFGNQDCSHEDFGWMQGYDKWYSAMFNRISHNSFSPYGVDTEKGREFVKHWLWNHQGDSDFHVGGICGIGVASACKQAPIGEDPEGRNAAAGVVGRKYVTRWGNGVDHALTIVGYDDRIVFDLDSNNVYGEKDKDECGAWIIVNSWGNGWANQGFIYCPYKYGFPVRQQEGGAWRPEFYHVRKNYRPLRTLKVRMDYLRRSELKLLVGISSDLSADEPDVTIELEHFKYAGDGRSDRAKMGIEARTPMLGKWADGKLHDEPMEFGYDLTDLSSGFDTRCPLKYFFIIETKPSAFSSGRLYNCSVLDYEFDRSGVETPLCTNGPLAIESGGHRTVVSTVVQGEPFFAPVNLRVAAGRELTWDAPQPTHYTLKSYVIYKDGAPSDTLSPATRHYSYANDEAVYSVAALYACRTSADTSVVVASARTSAVQPVTEQDGTPGTLRLEESGLVIPDIFRSRYEDATIEYWLKPRTWRNWNQSVGPGWGRFLIHANDNGALTAGWDGDNRIDTRAGLITPGQWYHFAFVVSKNVLSVYVNGELIETLASRSQKGIGGFGDLVFAADENGAFDGDLAEVRVWKEARTPEQIKQMMHSRFEAAGLPASLMAYYKGQVVDQGGVESWRDFAGGRHARFAPYGKHCQIACDLVFRVPGQAEIDFTVPSVKLYAGQAFDLQAIGSPSIARVRWDAPEGGVNALALKTASFLFADAGKHTVKLTGETIDGRTVTVEKEVDIHPVLLDATFRPTDPVAKAGERISFLPVSPVPGFRYEWMMSGADVEKAYTQNAAATYASAGDYKVKLRVTDAEGRKSKRSTYKLHVRNVMPVIGFDLSARVVQKGQKVTLTDRSRYAPTAWKWQLDSRRLTVQAAGANPTLRMDVPGVYDVTLTASNEVGSSTETQKQVLVVCNADSKNGLNFTRPEATLTTVKPLWNGATSQMTVDWWMNAAPQNKTTGMGHSAATWQMSANKQGNLTVHVDSAVVRSGNGFILTGQWHHYAVTFDKGQVTFLRDGEYFASARMHRKKHDVQMIPAFPALRIGGGDNPVNAVIDELRVWKTALADTTIQAYCNAPIADVATAEQRDSLVVYYSFNQSGGDVQDQTSNVNNGQRDNFGPDGDAWGLSSGVFCLNFETPLTDLTADLLPPSIWPFATTGQSVNKTDDNRFLAYDPGAGDRRWYVENPVVNDTVRTGMYVDRNKGNALCVYTGWDGFAGELTNHKCYTTVTLPAGKYELEVQTDGNAAAVGTSRLVVSSGKGLPDTQNLDKALASCMLSDLRLSFLLDKPTEVSLGMLFNLQGRSGIAISRILLRQASIER